MLSRLKSLWGGQVPPERIYWDYWVPVIVLPLLWVVIFIAVFVFATVLAVLPVGGYFAFLLVMPFAWLISIVGYFFVYFLPSSFVFLYSFWILVLLFRVAKVQPVKTSYTLWVTFVCMVSLALSGVHARQALSETADAFRTAARFSEKHQNYPAARFLCDTGYSIHVLAAGRQSPKTGAILADCASLRVVWKDYGDAEQMLKESLQVDLAGPIKANTYRALGDLYMGQKNHLQAIEAYKSAVKTREDYYHYLKRSPASWDLFLLGKAYVESGDYVEAESVLEKSLMLAETARERDDKTIADRLAYLGTTYYWLGKYDKAENALERCLALREKVFGKNSPQIARTLADLSSVYDKLGKSAESDEAYKRCKTIKPEKCKS